MAVFVEAGRGRLEWEARKSKVDIGRREGDPGKAVQAGKRGKTLMFNCNTNLG